MSEAVPWLPPSALTDVRTAEPVAQALAEWSAAWLAAGSLAAAVRWESCEGADKPLGYAQAGSDKGFRLFLREDARFEFAALLLGHAVGERECRTAHDQVVIGHLVEVAIAALGEALSNVLGVSEASAAADWYALPISAQGSAIARLEVPRAALVALAREWAGLAGRGEPLPGRRVSLGDQSVTLSAQVGTSRLALAEIEALEIGDVLTLDTPVSAPVAACIDGARAGDAALALAPGDGTLTFQIVRPANQW